MPRPGDHLLAAWDCERIGMAHQWQDAGGGMQVCELCLAERWDPQPPADPTEDQ
jgi:hypothetical protein